MFIVLVMTNLRFKWSQVWFLQRPLSLACGCPPSHFVLTWSFSDSCNPIFPSFYRVTSHIRLGYNFTGLILIRSPLYRLYLKIQSKFEILGIRALRSELREEINLAHNNISFCGCCCWLIRMVLKAPISFYCFYWNSTLQI